VTAGLLPAAGAWVSWDRLQTLLQLAGFACATIAAGFALGRVRGASAVLERRALDWTRAGFLLLGGAVAVGALGAGKALWPDRPRQWWGLAAWLIFFVVLHVHRVKDFKGRTAAAAGLGGWVLAALAWVLLR